MAKDCVLCGAELSLLNREKLYSFGTEQLTCKNCYKKLVELPANERARRILATGRAVAADILQEELSKQESRYEAKRNARLSDKPCVRCGAPMLKMGRQQFQLGEHGLFMGDMAHMLAGSLTLELFCCERCRKVEFFVPENENALDKV